MTSRECVLESINHKQPAKLPLDLGGTPSSGISAMGYNKLKALLGINDRRNKVYDVVQQVAQPELNVLDALKVDVLCIGRAFNDKDSDWYDVTLSDGTLAQYPAWFHPAPREDGGFNVIDEDGDIIARMPANGFCFDETVFPYVEGFPEKYDGSAGEMPISKAMDKVLWQKLAHAPWDNAGMPDFWGELRRRAQKLRDTSDRALIITCGCNLFEWGCFLRKMDNWLMDIYSEPEEVERLCGVLTEIHLKSLENVCNAVGAIVDIIRIGDDLGMSTGMFMSAEKYRTIFKPYHTKMCSYIHAHSSAKTFLHTCGSISPIIPDLIEAGYDIINPVQITAKDMEPAYLKREFGRDVTFWGGGCNTQSVLNMATPDEVYSHVRKMIYIFFKDGECGGGVQQGP